MQIAVIYSGLSQVQLSCKVEEGATVGQVIEGSGILKMCQDIDLNTHKIGIFGRFVKLETPLTDGDRIEIYRKIIREIDDDDDDDD